MEQNKKQTVIVGLSGGVDSAVSAFLLKKQNYEVIGIFMVNWDETINNDILGHKSNFKQNGCSSNDDYKDARKIAKQLGIELIKVNFVKEYWELVFTKMLDEYKKMLTPNPDVLCNKFIKFGLLSQYAKKKYPQALLATGHYAKLVKTKNQNHLYIPKDENKDQTYFLCALKNDQLDNVIFPLENLLKNEVRKIAKDNKLVVANKKDSTGICFIGERNFKQFLENYFPKNPGKILLLPSKNEVGKHDGLIFYTIGQRHGLNIGGMKEKAFVYKKNIKRNELIIAPISLKNKYLISKKAIVNNFNWINKEIDYSKYLNKKLLVRFRHRQELIGCEIVNINIEKNQITIIYPTGSIAVTPGQYAVIYTNKKKCLGGGTIFKIMKNFLTKKVSNE